MRHTVVLFQREWWCDVWRVAYKQWTHIYPEFVTENHAPCYCCGSSLLAFQGTSLPNKEIINSKFWHYFSCHCHVVIWKTTFNSSWATLKQAVSLILACSQRADEPVAWIGKLMLPNWANADLSFQCHHAGIRGNFSAICEVEAASGKVLRLAR